MLDSQKGKIKNALPYLYIALALLVIFLIIGNLKIQRVGDGAEYYALYYAWDMTGKPWMSAAAYDAFEELSSSNNIINMIPRSYLENAFPNLRVGLTSDFNHFWFYSLLAFLCANIFSIIGLELQIHESFLVLHYFLLAGLAFISYKYFKWRGVIAVTLLTLVSPMLWYLDKVHTELFTYSLVLSSIVLISAKKYIPSAFFLALASTQNPSFALVACIPIFHRVVLQRDKPYTIFDVGLIVTTVLLVLAHPVYYFTRYGVVTPQLLAGGASLGENLSYFYIWFIDPDVGLLPNWPLGVAALVVALILWITRKKDQSAKIDKSWVTFFILYLLINIYAHSSTTNLNSGATPGLARYALWYLPLAFPFIYKITAYHSTRRKGFYFLISIVLIISILSMHRYNPDRPESYTSPTALSFFIQSKLPWLYNPPAEIFLERYSGYGESSYTNEIRGIVGPDCRKLLLLPDATRQHTITPGGCLFDSARLEKHIDFLSSNISHPKYIRLSESEISNLTHNVSRNIYKLGSDKNAGFILGKGWSHRERWGVWSKNKIVTLVIPCDDQQFFSPGEEFSLSIKVQAFGKQSLIISAVESVLWQGKIEAQSQNIQLKIPSNNCKEGRSSISIKISNPTSPLELGLSSDNRKLGIGLLEFQITE